MLGEQLILPRLSAYFDARPGGYRRCSSCRALLLLTTSHWHRDRRSPAGLTLTCKACRYRNDIRWGSRPVQIPKSPPIPQDPIQAATERMLAAQLQAAREGAPIPTPTLPKRTRPVLALVQTRPPYCPHCDRACDGPEFEQCSCGAVVRRAAIVDGVAHLDIETELARGRTRYRGRTDFKLLDMGGDESDAIHVEKQLGSAWITVFADDTREEFRRLCMRVRFAARERRL